jgi:hypothetical protein
MKQFLFGIARRHPALAGTSILQGQTHKPQISALTANNWFSPLPVHHLWKMGRAAQAAAAVRLVFPLLVVFFIVVFVALLTTSRTRSSAPGVRDLLLFFWRLPS